jgi:hypothetical protein
VTWRIRINPEHWALPNCWFSSLEFIKLDDERVPGSYKDGIILTKISPTSICNTLKVLQIVYTSMQVLPS